MFKKILIANRGEIAVRIQRTCRELGIPSVALYTPADGNSLHVRFADECVPLESPKVFVEIERILEIAEQFQVDAIHPGYGFLAERADFIRACEERGVTFIGSTSAEMEGYIDKIAVLEKAERNGFTVVEHSKQIYSEIDLDAIAKEAQRLGYPVVVKSIRGGRGRGEKLVNSPVELERAIRRAQSEAQAVYGQRCVYLEKALMAAHQVTVQILGDQYGKRIHLGDREGSILYGNQKLFEESPSPFLGEEKRREILDTALRLADLFEVNNLASIEFLVSPSGEFHFTEIKPRIQIDHPLTEMRSRLDLLREQIRISAGEALGITQEQVSLNGHAMECRVTAQDPWKGFLPSPGNLRTVRFPSGFEVRVDSHISGGCEISSEYDPLIAKLTVWGMNRQECFQRMKRALNEVRINGVRSNLLLLKFLTNWPAIEKGVYDTSHAVRQVIEDRLNRLPEDGLVSQSAEITNSAELRMQELAAAVAIYYARRSQMVSPSIPERLNTGWHRQSRKLPE